MTNEATPSNRATLDDLMRLVLTSTEVRIEGIDKPFAIRPLTWKEDLEIDQIVTGITNLTDRARERTKLIVWTALMDPKITKDDVSRLPVGLVIRLADEIMKISSFLQRKT